MFCPPAASVSIDAIEPAPLSGAHIWISAHTLPNTSRTTRVVTVDGGYPQNASRRSEGAATGRAGLRAHPTPWVSGIGERTPMRRRAAGCLGHRPTSRRIALGCRAPSERVLPVAGRQRRGLRPDSARHELRGGTGHMVAGPAAPPAMVVQVPGPERSGTSATDDDGRPPTPAGHPRRKIVIIKGRRKSA